MSPRTKKKAPTVSDVAELAGVGFATAARTLGGYGSVSAEVRERVMLAAKSIGYRPNRLARSMVTGSSRTIGAVVADIENPFFARIVRGISDQARAAGFDVVLVNSDESASEERAAVRMLVEKRVDGLIVAPAAVDEFGHLAELRDLGLPIVLLDRNIPKLGVDAVVIDGMRAAEAATAHLIALGHTRISIITDVPPKTPLPKESAHRQVTATAGARLAGFLRALRSAGLPVDEDLIRTPGSTVASAYREAAALIDLEEPPTAIFTTDNIMTLGAFEALRDRRVRVPADISLFGFDDSDWSHVVDPPISVVAQPVYELGATAARRLLSRIERQPGPPQVHVLPTELLLRRSTRKPRHARLRLVRTSQAH